MSKQRYPEEFKAEAVKQITERGHKVADAASIGALPGYRVLQTLAALLPGLD